MTPAGLQLGALPIVRLYEAYTAAAAAAVVPLLPAGLNPIAWIDTSQQIGTDGAVLSSLQDNADSTRLYVGGAGLYQVNRKNGLPTLNCTSGSYQCAANPVAIAINSPCLFWMVMQTTGSDNYFWSGAGNQQIRFNYSYNRSMLWYSGGYAESDPLTPAENTVWAIYISHRNAANQVRHYYNGLPKFRTPPILSSAFTLSRALGGYYNLSAEFAEAGVLSGDPSQAQINQLGSYLAGKWAIAWTNI